jgi:subtilisin family serine protease
MAAMVEIAAAIKNHSLDFGYAPKAATPRDLKKALDGFYIKVLPRDAWGGDFIYGPDAEDPERYRLASAGSDGVFKGFGQSGVWRAEGGQDVILTNKPPSWVYAPAIEGWPLPDLAWIGNASESAPAPAPAFFTRLNPGSTPGIVRRPAPFAWGADGARRGPLTILPAAKPGSRDPYEIDLRGYDLSALDLKNRLSDLLRASFDDHTVWPAGLPEGFEPARFMEIGRNPGLGVRRLHERGITGKGVGIAVIDMGFLADHVEYRDRVRHFEEIHAADETAQMHGVACASIAAGRTVGVAPEADLYYIAHFPGSGDASAPDGGQDAAWIAKGIERILDVNAGLAEGRKIRVISVSNAWQPGKAGFAEATAAVERAKREGIFVVCADMSRSYGFLLCGLGRDPLANPDRVDSFGEPWFGGIFPHEGAHGEEALFVPMDSRTTASPTAPDAYVFYGRGGLSWSVPWAAGLYALACQAKPEVTPELFWATALETGDVLPLPAKWPNPTPAEIDARVRKTMDERMAAFMKRFEGKDLEVIMAGIYSQATGDKKERMGEADFRAWGEPQVRAELLPDTKPRELKKIVHPVRLIEALRKGRA